MAQTQVVVNNDVEEWKAAKARRDRERHFKSICKKVERLEEIVDKLQLQIKEIVER